MAEIALPFREDDQPLLEAIDALDDALDRGQDYDVSHQVLLDAMLTDGTQTVGELCEQLADPEQARQLGDRARQNLGLTTFTEQERRQKQIEATRWPPPPPTPPRRDEGGKAIMQCAAEDCERLSSDHVGNPAPTDVVKFFCDEHRDQAEPGDLEPFREVPQFDAGGGFAMAPAAELHYSQVYDRAVEEARRKGEQRAAERERLNKLEEEYHATLKPPENWIGS